MNYKDNRDKLNKIANTWGSTGNQEPDWMNNKIQEQAKADPRLKMFKVYDGLSPKDAYLVGWNNPELGMEALRQSQEARSRHYTGGTSDYYPVSYYDGLTNPAQNPQTKVSLVTDTGTKNASYNTSSGAIKIYNDLQDDTDFTEAMASGKHEVKHHATQGQPRYDVYNMRNLIPRTWSFTMPSTAHTAMLKHPQQFNDPYSHMLHDTDPTEQEVGWHIYKQTYANKFNQLPPNNYDGMIEDGVTKGMFIKDDNGHLRVNPRLINDDKTRGMEMIDAGFTYRNNLIDGLPAPDYPKLPTTTDYLFRPRPKIKLPQVVRSPYTTPRERTVYTERLYREAARDFIDQVENYKKTPWQSWIENYYHKNNTSDNSKLIQHWDTMQRHNYPQASVSGKRNYMNPYIKVKG